MRSTARGLLLVSVTLALGPLAGGSSAATKCVNPTGTEGCFSTIPAALAAAAVDDSIVVFPGIYRDTLRIDKRVTLLARGVESTVISPAAGSNAVTFVSGSSGAKVIGFTIEAPVGIGVYSHDSSIDVLIANSVIRGCANCGVWFDNAPGTLRIHNCVIWGNSVYGIYVTDGRSYVYGNIIAGNHAGGLRYGYYRDGGVNEYNCLYSNNVNYLEYAAAGFGDIALDPGFVDGLNGDFHLQAGSPCIDTGRPGTSYLDCDGTRNDMGVYGGPDAYCGPGPVVTSLQLVPATVVKGQTFQDFPRNLTSGFHNSFSLGGLFELRSGIGGFSYPREKRGDFM